MELCLNMIVKDEESCIEQCIKSVAPFISYYVIVDTGSKDNTIQKIKEVTEELGIPGEVHERPWVDFAHNRTEALRLALGKCDYRFMMDADDLFIPEEGVNPFEGIDKTKSSHGILLKFGGLEYTRNFLFKSDDDWMFKGVLHEYPHIDDEAANSNRGFVIPKCYIKADISPLKRANSLIEKYANDAKILEKAFKKEPDNTRYAFYLAQSYRDSQQKEKAIKAYRRRANMKGWDEEVYISLLQVALLLEETQRPVKEVIEAYSLAWECRPHRLEAVYYLMRLLRLNNRYVLAFTYGNMAAQNYREVDVLFVSAPIKNWMFMDEYCMAAYYVGQPQLAYENAKKFIESDRFKEVPEEEQARLLKNFSYYENKVNETEKKDS
jgi:glycosyltransferase involved in cell wall biosynthesis